MDDAERSVYRRALGTERFERPSLESHVDLTVDSDVVADARGARD